MSADKIVVMGIGYVGLPLAVMLAASGYEVVGVDVDSKVVESVNNGALDSEPEIISLLKREDLTRRFSAREKPCEADVYIISVPTPIDERKRIGDLSYVNAAARSIVPFLHKGCLVIVESTVPPLTCRETIIPILSESGLTVGEDIYLAHCPERILPGKVIQEIISNDRVIGGINRQSALMARDIYNNFVKGQIFVTDDITAELIKLIENTYRDVNIALANEIAAVCSTLGVNVMEAIYLANQHPRVNVLSPGIGTGGHCIPVDPWFIKEVDPVNTKLIHTAREINESIPERIAAEIRKAVRDIRDPHIVALGMTYKPGTNDTRNSPALRIIEMLRGEGYTVQAFDPRVAGREFDSICQIAQNADLLVVLVEHPEIVSELEGSLEAVKNCMRTPRVIRFYR